MDETQPLLPPVTRIESEQQQHAVQNLVDFDANGDHDNPLDWSKGYRWLIVLLLAFMAFIV